MRPIPSHQISEAVKITARMPSVHGAPVHIGHPESLGISDVNKPDFGDASRIEAGEIPVFWACGVTPQAAVMNSKFLLPLVMHRVTCLLPIFLTALGWAK